MTPLNVPLIVIGEILIGLIILFDDTLFDLSNQICQPSEHIFVLNLNTNITSTKHTEFENVLKFIRSLYQSIIVRNNEIILFCRIKRCK